MTLLRYQPGGHAKLLTRSIGFSPFKFILTRFPQRIPYPLCVISNRQHRFKACQVFRAEHTLDSGPSISYTILKLLPFPTTIFIELFEISDLLLGSFERCFLSFLSLWDSKNEKMSNLMMMPFPGLPLLAIARL